MLVHFLPSESLQRAPGRGLEALTVCLGHTYASRKVPPGFILCVLNTNGYKLPVSTHPPRRWLLLWMDDTLRRKEAAVCAGGCGLRNQVPGWRNPDSLVHTSLSVTSLQGEFPGEQ